MINLIIHPGLSKTGTTFLQERIFRKINCNLLSKVLCDSLGVLQYDTLKSKINTNFIYNDVNKQFLVKRLYTSNIYYVLSKLHINLKKYNYYWNNFRKSKLLNLIYNIFRPSVKTQIQKPLENELELRKKILEIYSDSNRELDRITDADLKKYNYY